MKVIVDTNVWSLSLRRRKNAKLNTAEQQLLPQLKAAIQNRQATILGLVRQEVLSGIRDKEQFANVKELLDPFVDEEIVAGDYIEAARLYNLCRDEGVECGPVDILICAVAVRNHWDILTTDAGMMRCIGVLRHTWHLL